MNDMVINVIGNLTLDDLGSAPNDYPEEAVAAGFDVIRQMEGKLKEYKQNITGNLLRRMDQDNATKLIFLDVKGNKKTLTVKKGAMKLNSAIKNPEEYIKKSGFEPEMLGSYKFVPFTWGEIKEVRKQGGELQVLCDELYKEGQPSLTVE